MHNTSYTEMEKFIAASNEKFSAHEINVLDIGSQAIGTTQTYRGLITNPRWAYTGIDLCPGQNVNLIVDPYHWPYANGVFSVVMCGQCLEHSPRPWDLVKEAARVMTRGGLACFIVPHTFKYHTEGGDDCWRVWPAGMSSLLSCAELKQISVYKNAVDTVGIGTKL